MTVSVIVQARMASSRLQGKALRSLAGAPLIERVINRARLCKQAANVVLVASDRPEDAALRDFAAQKGVRFATGPTDDIVARLLAGATAGEAQTIVRVWGDCPFFCADIADQMLDYATNGKYEFLTNGTPRSVPPGLDCEVWTVDALRTIDGLANLEPQLREFPVEAFKQKKLDKPWGALPKELVPEYAADVHLTVDYPEDLAAAEALWRVMEDQYGAAFTAPQLISVLNAKLKLAHAFASAPRNIEYADYLNKLARASNGK
jgi:spore coat polysaccharide biosynthesis protein SpsF